MLPIEEVCDVHDKRDMLTAMRVRAYCTLENAEEWLADVRLGRAMYPAHLIATDAEVDEMERVAKNIRQYIHKLDEHIGALESQN